MQNRCSGSGFLKVKLKQWQLWCLVIYNFDSSVMNVTTLIHGLNASNDSVLSPSILADTSSSSSSIDIMVIIFAVIISCSTITAICCCIEWYVDRKHSKELEDRPEARDSKVSVHSASPRMSAHSCTCRPGLECEDPENCLYPMGLDPDNDSLSRL